MASQDPTNPPLRRCTLIADAGWSLPRAVRWLGTLAPDADVDVVVGVEVDWRAPRAVTVRRLRETEASLQSTLGGGFSSVNTYAVPDDELVKFASSLLGRAEVLALCGPPGEAHLPLLRRALNVGALITWPGARDVDAVDHLLVAAPRSATNGLSALRALAGRLSPGRTTLLQISAGEDRVQLTSPQAAALSGWSGPLSLASLQASVHRMSEALEGWIAAGGIDALALPVLNAEGGLTNEVTARWVARSLAAASTPVILSPAPGLSLSVAPRIGASDAVSALGGAVAIERVDPLGSPWPVDEERFELVSGGLRLGESRAEAGLLRLDDVDALPSLIGLANVGGDLLADLHGIARILRPGAERVGLFDASVSPTWIRRSRGERRWWGIRLDPSVPLLHLRARLDRGGADGLLDAAAALDEGPASDVPAEASSARLLRVARRLRAAGVRIDLVASAGPPEGGHDPRPPGFAEIGPERLRAASSDEIEREVAARYRAPGEDGLLERVAAPQSAARRLSVEWDNRRARVKLLRRIDGARSRIHLQTYIWEEDGVGEAIAAALAAAAARGVRVRVLVDALYSRAGVPVLNNALIERLATRPGVELLRIRPVDRLGVVELKRRNHRKIAIFDGEVAWVSGRNIGRSYYTGFDEVRLRPDSEQGEVPWLDAGAEVEGAVVREIDAAFLDAWCRAGGEPFALLDPGEAGALPVRLVLHDGLEDAHTLELYRVLFDGAREQITVVNTFPLIEELRHALQRALQRGVRVRYLLGNVRPLRGDRSPFPGGAVREIATELIHGRVDALLTSGAEVWEFGQPASPGWSPRLAQVLPHVHAKLISVDGRAFAIGSANLDVTASYWESEAVLLVEDPEEAAEMERALDALLARSSQVRTDDPRWQATASRRALLSAWWPSWLG